MPAVTELELDLEAFEGPFDLLLSLVLRDEMSL
ncbi:MAG: chromosome segregation protein ScpA, partial [Actinobacteria bacterium]|nr:chromosome segregation protein ScpA [Actinomycetota bacterium]